MLTVLSNDETWPGITNNWFVEIFLRSLRNIYSQQNFLNFRIHFQTCFKLYRYNHNGRVPEQRRWNSKTFGITQIHTVYSRKVLQAWEYFCETLWISQPAVDDKLLKHSRSIALSFHRKHCHSSIIVDRNENSTLTKPNRNRPVARIGPNRGIGIASSTRPIEANCLIIKILRCVRGISSISRTRTRATTSRRSTRHDRTSTLPATCPREYFLREYRMRPNCLTGHTKTIN